MIPQFVLDALTYEQREHQWNQALVDGESGVFVAQSGGDVAGFACGCRNRDPDYETAYPGELQSIYLLERYQQKGLGRALFDAARTWLKAQGLVPFMLWVVTDNPACAFYERLGGTRIVTRPTDVRGANVIESGYAWR